MLPIRPYLIEAFYQWIVDSGMTPYVMVKVESSGVKAPKDYAANGELTLDLSPGLVDNLEINSRAISCTAYFDNGPFDLFLPIAAVVAIYAYENQEGISFEEDLPESLHELLSHESTLSTEEPPPQKKPNFSLIKDD